jgi:hypothetical protein
MHDSFNATMLQCFNATIEKMHEIEDSEKLMRDSFNAEMLQCYNATMGKMHEIEDSSKLMGVCMNTSKISNLKSPILNLKTSPFSHLPSHFCLKT